MMKFSPRPSRCSPSAPNGCFGDHGSPRSPPVDYKRIAVGGSKKLPSLNGRASANCSTSVTFFINNLPLGWPSFGIRKVFSWYGEVQRVFIPKKRSRNGSVFGFVSLKPNCDPSSILSKLNGSWLGKNKIAVNYAKPNPKLRSTNSSRIQAPKLQHSSKAFINKINGVDKRSYAHVLQFGKSHPSGISDDPPQNTLGSLDYIPSDSDMDWLRRSLVGWLHFPLNFSSINDKIAERGFRDCSCRPMGGNLVLITFSDDEVFHNITTNDMDWLSEWFEYIKPWEPKVVCSIRFAWLRCEGVPLHAWNSEFFAKVASLHGSYVGIDENTRLKTRFDVARILISTPMPEHIDKIIKPRIDGKIFAIRVVEEPCLLFPGDSRNPHRYPPSSVSDSEDDKTPVEDVHSLARDDDVSCHNYEVKSSRNPKSAACLDSNHTHLLHSINSVSNDVSAHASPPLKAVESNEILNDTSDNLVVVEGQKPISSDTDVGPFSNLTKPIDDSEYPVLSHDTSPNDDSPSSEHQDPFGCGDRSITYSKPINHSLSPISTSARSSAKPGFRKPETKRSNNIDSARLKVKIPKKSMSRSKSKTKMIQASPLDDPSLVPSPSSSGTDFSISDGCIRNTKAKHRALSCSPISPIADSSEGDVV